MWSETRQVASSSADGALVSEQGGNYSSELPDWLSPQMSRPISDSGCVYSPQLGRRAPGSLTFSKLLLGDERPALSPTCPCLLDSILFLLSFYNFRHGMGHWAFQVDRCLAEFSLCVRSWSNGTVGLSWKQVGGILVLPPLP